MTNSPATNATNTTNTTNATNTTNTTNASPVSDLSADTIVTWTRNGEQFRLVAGKSSWYVEHVNSSQIIQHVSETIREAMLAVLSSVPVCDVCEEPTPTHPVMSQSAFSALLTQIQADEIATRAQGQAEYAHLESNCHANFDDAAEQLNTIPEKILLILAHKHWRGIVSYVNGHHSQREDVRGRIKDLRLYLALLWGMVERTTASEVSDGNQ